MTSKSKTNYSVVSKFPAFYTGGRVQITSDGESLFSVCGRKVNVVDVATGMIRYSLAEDDEDEISCFTVSPDDTTLVVARRSFRVQQYDWRSQTLTRTWKALHSGPILCMDIDVTCTLLATGSSDLTVKVCDIQQKYYTHNFKANQGIVSIVRFHPDIERLQLFSVSGDNKIRVWDLKTSECIHTMDKHHSTVTDLHFANNDLLISCSRDSVVVLWDLRSWAVLKTIPVFEPLEGVSTFPRSTDLTRYNLAPKSGHFITVGQLGQLRVWDRKTGSCTYKQEPVIARNIKDEEQIPLITQVITTDSTSTVTVVTYDHNVLVYNAADLQLKKQLVGNNDEILDLKFLGEGDSHVAVVTNSEQLKVFELSSWDCRILQGHSDIVLCVDVCSRRHLMASGSKDNSIRLWSIADLTNIRCVAVLQGHVHAVGCVAFSRMSGRFLLSGSEDCTLKRWDLPKHLASSSDVISVTSSHTEQAHSKDINCVALAQNDSMLATASLDKTIKVWTSELSLVGVMRGHSRSVWCVQFSPVDKCVVSSSADGTIKIWALSDFTCVKTFEGHDSSVLSVSFVTAGLQLLSSGSDGLLKLWTIKSNQCVRTLDGHDGKVWCVAVTGDGDSLLSGGSDSVLVQWKDVTVEEMEESRQKQETFLLLEQELTNLVKEKNFAKAVRVALTLEQPFRLLAILKQMLEMAGGQTQVDSTLKSLRNDQLDTMLRFASEWNKNSKHCHVAQVVMSHVLCLLNPHDLMTFPNIRATLESFLPYTDRHYERLKRLHERTKFVEYTWSCMRTVTSTPSTAAEHMEIDTPLSTTHSDDITTTPPTTRHSTQSKSHTSKSTLNDDITSTQTDDTVKDVALAIRIAAQQRDIEN